MENNGNSLRSGVGLHQGNETYEASAGVVRDEVGPQTGRSDAVPVYVGTGLSDIELPSVSLRDERGMGASQNNVFSGKPKMATIEGERQCGTLLVIRRTIDMLVTRDFDTGGRGCQSVPQPFRKAISYLGQRSIRRINCCA
jgi:hypothetical protein